jgi:hypothetical protein
MINSYIETTNGNRYLLIEENDAQWLLGVAKDMLTHDVRLLNESNHVDERVIKNIQANIAKIEQAKNLIENDELYKVETQDQLYEI